MKTLKERKKAMHEELRQDIAVMRSNGLTLDRIAKKLGLKGRQGVWNIMNLQDDK